jgi:hypothetical protein
MNNMRNFLKIVGASLIVGSSVCYGVSLETSMEGYTLDWSSSRLKLKVSAESSGSEDDSYSAVEKKAWANGIAEIRKISKDVYTAHYAVPADAGGEAVSPGESAGLRAARGVFSKNTQYVSDGSVVVSLEARLSSVLAPLQVAHAVEEKPDHKTLENTTGVVLKLSCEMEPRADLKIEDEDGEVLYAPNLISKKAYSEVLSGRWYKKPRKWEIRRAAGKSPKEVSVTCLEDGRFVASSDAWEAIDSAERDVIVQAARAAIVVP